ncbi:hypothetical protein PsYK624_145930 [Phanerochaete sordida]|uniref:Uncharacterized protein n=1 Tax=Phanerochaete sordida TaxID=48140 RepID=A0A9P3LL65_9APHY|nr:hypothetical protein PsYK624_145930 [Phanerochaete sordida]
MVLTWVKTFSHWRNLRRAGLRSSISTLLLRDGTLFFLILAALNVAQMLTYTTRNSIGDGANFADAFLQSLPPVLIQRFMLNLRQFASPTEQSIYGPSAVQMSTVRFQERSSPLGNIGESLYFRDLDPDEDETDLASSLDLNTGDKGESLSIPAAVV